MKANNVDNLIHTISRAGASQNEMMLALAFTMAGLMEQMGSNLMDVKINQYVRI